MDIHKKILAYHRKLAVPHARFRSWEHCFRFFQANGQKGIYAQRDYAALHLGFYLASWGMYRGSTFLLKHAYTIHLGVIDCLASPELSPLWQLDFGSEVDHGRFVHTILKASDSIRKAYSSAISHPSGSRDSTDTLVTKVMLGTLGCVPACDRYFLIGFRRARLRYPYLKYSRLNGEFLERLVQFCSDNLSVLQLEQARIERLSGLRYPLMKLIDMYFWQIGLDVYGHRGIEH